MAKEIMVRPEEFSNIVLSDAEADAYKFLLAHAGIKMDEGAEADFVTKRNLKSEAISRLAEKGKFLEAAAASIKEVVKHGYNCGREEDLPPNVKWSKQSYTYAFEEGQARAIAQSLIDSGLCTKEQIFDAVSVTGMQKAAGITTDKMLELFHDGIVIKPKERTLTVK